MTDGEILYKVWDLINPHGVYYSPISKELYAHAWNKRKLDVSIHDLKCILAMADGTPEDETKKLLDFFWGIPVLPKGKETPKVDKNYCTSHQWVEVMLFNVTTQRCAYCDIKKPADAKD